jgi:hypothetical protein
MQPSFIHCNDSSSNFKQDETCGATGQQSHLCGSISATVTKCVLRFTQFVNQSPLLPALFCLPVHTIKKLKSEGEEAV